MATVSIKRHVLPGEEGGDTAWFYRQNSFGRHYQRRRRHPRHVRRNASLGAFRRGAPVHA